MSTRLVILGLLRERPLYGYEIKQLIEQYMGDWTSIAFGSIYFALDKLAEEKLIEKVATEQEGGRPSRTVYQITQAGRDEFLRLLRELWTTWERQYYAFDIGVWFMEALPLEERKAYLRQRIERLEYVLQFVGEDKGQTVARPDVPQLAEAIFDHVLVHVRADLEWVSQLLEKIENGTYL